MTCYDSTDNQARPYRVQKELMHAYARPAWWALAINENQWPPKTDQTEFRDQKYIDTIRGSISNQICLL